MYVERRGLSTCERDFELSVAWSAGVLWFERVAGEVCKHSPVFELPWSMKRTGVSGGEENVGVGSMVERADAPVSPLSSPPRLLDFRLGRVFNIVLPLDQSRSSCIRGGL